MRSRSKTGYPIFSTERNKTGRYLDAAETLYSSGNEYGQLWGVRTYVGL